MHVCVHVFQATISLHADGVRVTAPSDFVDGGVYMVHGVTAPSADIGQSLPLSPVSTVDAGHGDAASSALEVEAQGSVGDCSGRGEAPAGASDALHRFKWGSLTPVHALGVGAFGTVQKMKLPSGAPVAVKANGVACSDTAAIENERVLFQRLLLEPHPNILQVTDHLSRARMKAPCKHWHTPVQVYAATCPPPLPRVVGVFAVDCCTLPPLDFSVCRFSVFARMHPMATCVW